MQANDGGNWMMKMMPNWSIHPLNIHSGSQTKCRLCNRFTICAGADCLQTGTELIITKWLIQMALIVATIMVFTAQMNWKGIQKLVIYSLNIRRCPFK
jgi:hypothetical protein